MSVKPSEILIAVLGAGSARRFGADKLAQPCGGQPLGSWAMQAALATDAPVVWIAGNAAPAWVACNIAENPRAAEGIGTSVALAARLAANRGAKALLVMLADMPLVTTRMLHELIACGAPAAFRQADERPGVPALIPATLFDRLTGLTRDQGAGRILAAERSVTLLEAPAGALLDVDTPATMAMASQLLSQSRQPAGGRQEAADLNRRTDAPAHRDRPSSAPDCGAD